MTVLGYRFLPKIWSIILTSAFVYLFIELGYWQSTVTLPGSPVKLDDFQYRQVEIRGEYLPAETILLDNKTHQGLAGYHVITPIKIANSSMHVLINRGWIATGNDRAVLPELPDVQGEVVVNGVVVSPEQKMLKLSNQTTAGIVWENLSLQRYQEATGLKLQPILVLQNNTLDDGLVRQWDRPDSGAAKNLGYAVQWFSLAATAIIIFLVLNVKRKYSESQ